MLPLNIAVIGSGISGLSAAWLLDKKHNVTLFEADDRLGGHSNTVEMDIDGTPVPVDTGFICFNTATYPNLIALFKHLNVPVHDTVMSFSASIDNGAYEYSGGTYLGMVGQPSNILKPKHWRMIRDILRFFREAPKALDTLHDNVTLAVYLERENYSPEFVDRHLLPMAAAIWSSKMGDMMGYPAKSFIRFFQNHGLLQVENRPKWGTVKGGSRVYVEKILQDSKIETHTNSQITRIERDALGVTLHFANREPERFHQVVIASHADQALQMLDKPTVAEQALLGSFGYAKNTAVLHRDRRYMPKRKMTWASWNYLDFGHRGEKGKDTDLCVTYWMNSLQSLQTKKNVFVTLNPSDPEKIENVAASFDYMHPVFDVDAMRAQQEIWAIQGDNHTWFCGAHFGSGFHEDGLQAGLAVAEELGGVRRPWTVANESGRIFIHPRKDVLEAAE